MAALAVWSASLRFPGRFNQSRNIVVELVVGEDQLALAKAVLSPWSIACSASCGWWSCFKKARFDSFKI
jgi:hypothetical protein